MLSYIKYMLFEKKSVTMSLIVLCVVMFLVGMFFDRASFYGAFSLIPGMVSLANPQSIFSFISSMFVHADIWHLLFNMWFLWFVGFQLEEVLGSVKFLSLYLAGGIIAGLAQFISDPGLMIAIVGASGAISAIFGTYAFLFPKKRLTVMIGFVPMNMSFYSFAVFWFIFQLLGSSTGGAIGGNIAWYAHIGGFLFGLLVGYLLKKYDRRLNYFYRF